MPGAPASTSARVGGWLSDQPYLLLSLTSLFWAGNTVLGRFVVGHIPPMTLAFGRWAGAFLILLPFAAGHLRHDWPIIRKHAGMMTLLAFTGFSAYNTMAYYGLQYTTAINGLLLQSIGPLFVALWTFALFGDRLTLRQAGGICVSLSGVIVIICHGSLAILLGIASPLLELQDPVHGLIGLVILFVGIRFAWRFTAGRTLAVSGPHTPSPAGLI